MKQVLKSVVGLAVVAFISIALFPLVVLAGLVVAITVAIKAAVMLSKLNS